MQQIELASLRDAILADEERLCNVTSQLKEHLICELGRLNLNRLK